MADIMTCIMADITTCIMVDITECIMVDTLPSRAIRAITLVGWDLGLVSKCGVPCTTTRHT